MSKVGTTLTARQVMRPFRNDKDGLPSVYVRVAQLGKKFGYAQRPVAGESPFQYDDFQAGGRILKGSRVEEAVEMTDFMKLAHAEGLNVIFHCDGLVRLVKPAIPGRDSWAWEGKSIREAYIKYELKTYGVVR